MGRLKMTLEIRHGLALHKRLIQSDRSSTEGRTFGRYTQQVCAKMPSPKEILLLFQIQMLQEYVGELMIMLYEERKLQLITDFAREDGFSRQSAVKRLQSIQRVTMLLQLNNLWTNFLQVQDSQQEDTLS